MNASVSYLVSYSHLMVISVGTVLVTLPHQLLSNASPQSAALDRRHTRKQPDLLLVVGHARGGPCGRMLVRHVLQNALQGIRFGAPYHVNCQRSDSISSGLRRTRLYCSCHAVVGNALFAYQSLPRTIDAWMPHSTLLIMCMG